MKQVLLKIVKAFLIFTAVVLGILLIFGVILSLKWPWWTGLFILIGLLGIWIGIIFIRKLWLKRREQNFVSNVIEQDDLYLKQLSSKERERSGELQDRWTEAIAALKHSHLKKHGNPLYVLPWYMLIGESGSGKTTAIESARLSSPFAEVNRTSGISGTRNCDWWFFEQAILLDTAGRYAIPVDEGRDKEEWQKFLSLLAKFRKKEPLNGLVVTLSADKLLESDPGLLEEDGKSIRQRTDELMRVIGARFPVYVLVTKCDLIQGMNQFCDHLSEAGLNQAMGRINRTLTADLSPFIDRVMQSVGERLRNYRLLIFHKRTATAGRLDSQGDIDPAPLLFPEEFERLKIGLEAFINGAFQKNPYQETPLLRGIFFSSGRQEGSPYSHFLKELGLIEEREVLPGTNKGLFLHDFFSRILPLDRGLFRPTQRALDWNRLTKNLGLTSWIAVGIALSGLLSFSFVTNLRELKDVSDKISTPTAMEGNILADMPVMDGFRIRIEDIVAGKQRWWIPSFGLSQSKKAETKLKRKYCDQFRTFIIEPYDQQMEDTITGFSAATADDVIGLTVNQLVRRIHLLQSRLDGQRLEELQEKPRPSLEALAIQLDHPITGEENQKFGELYVTYLDWRSDTSVIRQEMIDLQKLLTHILNAKRPDLRWLVAGANQDPSLADAQIFLEDFWGAGLAASANASVDAAFTIAGKAALDAFLDEIETALVDPLTLAKKRSDFEQWYKNAYLDAWKNFATMFPIGEELLGGRNSWQQVATLMATDQGPYFLLLATMTAQLEPFARSFGDGTQLPAWLKLVYELKAAELQAANEEAVQKKSLLAKATQKGKTLIGKLDEKTGLLPGGEQLTARMAAGKAYYDYRTGLDDIALVSSSRNVAFQMAGKVYKEVAGGDAPFFKALNAVNRLKTSIKISGPEQIMFWKLVTGPLDFFWQYMSNETACRLQKLWEDEVLVEIEGISDQLNLKKILFVDPGYTASFVKGPAAPFIGRSLKKGYHARDVFGSSIPFEAAFFSFLNRGVRPSKAVKPNYYVTISGRPTSANAEARIQPHATRLELQCARKPQVMINRQYPVKKTFDWSPQNCGDVLFQIEVGNLTLTRKYTGKRAFAKFLKVFAKGHHTFYPADFPKESAALKRLKIKKITVRYNLSGHQKVIQPPGPALGSVPMTIVQCWEP